MCVSRPRRFGKSVTVKMLAAYYSRGCDSYELFQNLNIAGKPGFRQELNRYPVIYLDIQWFYSVARDKGMQEQVISYMQREVLKELRQQYPDQGDACRERVC